MKRAARAEGTGRTGRRNPPPARRRGWGPDRGGGGSAGQVRRGAGWRPMVGRVDLTRIVGSVTRAQPDVKGVGAGSAGRSGGNPKVGGGGQGRPRPDGPRTGGSVDGHVGRRATDRLRYRLVRLWTCVPLRPMPACPHARMPARRQRRRDRPNSAPNAVGEVAFGAELGGEGTPSPTSAEVGRPASPPAPTDATGSDALGRCRARDRSGAARRPGRLVRGSGWLCGPVSGADRPDVGPSCPPRAAGVPGGRSWGAWALPAGSGPTARSPRRSGMAGRRSLWATTRAAPVGGHHPHPGSGRCGGLAPAGSDARWERSGGAARSVSRVDRGGSGWVGCRTGPGVGRDGRSGLPFHVGAGRQGRGRVGHGSPSPAGGSVATGAGRRACLRPEDRQRGLVPRPCRLVPWNRRPRRDGPAVGAASGAGELGRST